MLPFHGVFDRETFFAKNINLAFHAVYTLGLAIDQKFYGTWKFGISSGIGKKWCLLARFLLNKIPIATGVLVHYIRALHKMTIFTQTAILRPTWHFWMTFFQSGQPSKLRFR